ncbi:MAG: radical SAM family heme chaperone HemW [Limnochordia bacterium]|jgi:oxygen-independent coproporphyrinogen-3 oxidase
MKTEFGIYIHWPFCLAKCHYCDFNSYPVASGFQARYLEALLLEINGIHLDQRVTSIYFGGGTPTVFPPRELNKVLEACARRFSLAADCEISVEANPDTLNPGVLRDLLAGGFNRLTLGIQSFDDRYLKMLGRTYGRERIPEVLRWVEEVSWPNVGIDLIYNLPGQDLAHWEGTLKEACRYDLDHLSCYSLQVEEGTPLARWVQKGLVALPDEEIQRAMIYLTGDFLKAQGWDHYELANFARQGRRGRHNLNYWHNGPYLGFGAGAHSFYQRRRWSNLAHPREYIDGLATGNIVAEEYLLGRDEEMDDTAFLGLRLLEGIDLDRFKQRFGVDFSELYRLPLDSLSPLGLIEETATHVRLTRQALPIANQVFAAFIRG